MKATTALQGAGVAALVLFPFYRSLIDMPGDMRMHSPVSVTLWAFSLIANLILVSLIFTFVGVWLHGTSSRTWWKLFLPALVLASLAEMINIARSGWISTALWIIVLIVILFLSFVLRWRWPKGEKALLQLSGAALIGLGFFCIFVVLQMLHMAMWHQSPNSIGNPVPVATTPNDRPRIVWILFDELSYRQTFGDRYPDLQLPNFDELRKSSTLFTDVQPLVNKTEKAIPSILIGQRITRVDYTSRNRLIVGRSTGAMYPFDAAQTPFAVARQKGLTTGVIGWYNPYCSILSPYLNQCYWTVAMPKPGMHPPEIFRQYFLSPWVVYGKIFDHPRQLLSRSYRKFVVEDLMEPQIDEVTDTADYRVRTYQDLMQHADSMLLPSGPDFVLIHLPIPHPPAFYSRRTGRFDKYGHGSYIDNLALSDKALGHLLTILKQSPRWKNTSVVICGDHSWRVYMWANVQYWTAEDQAASHGAIFDPRPMLMVHLAGQTTAGTVDVPFPLLGVHNILDNLAEGKLPSFLATSH